ncbi:Splicing factor U2af large subunit B [Glycine soja]
MLQPTLVAPKVVCLTHTVYSDELKDDEDYEEILDDMRQECSKFDSSLYNLCPRMLVHCMSMKIYLHISLFLFSLYECTLVNVVIPRPPPDGEPVSGVGKQVDTSVLGLPPHEAKRSPYIASIGVCVFKTYVLLKLLKWRYPTPNDFDLKSFLQLRENNVHVREIALNISAFKCLIYSRSSLILHLQGTKHSFNEVDSRYLLFSNFLFNGLCIL